MSVAANHVTSSKLRRLNGGWTWKHSNREITFHQCNTSLSCSVASYTWSILMIENLYVLLYLTECQSVLHAFGTLTSDCKILKLSFNISFIMLLFCFDLLFQKQWSKEILAVSFKTWMHDQSGSLGVVARSESYNFAWLNISKFLQFQLVLFTNKN